MQMYEEREKAINDARQLLIELNNIRKTFKSDKEKGENLEENALLTSAQSRILEQLEQCRKRANLSRGHFQNSVCKDLYFSEAHPFDEKVGKLKSCNIKKIKLKENNSFGK